MNGDSRQSVLIVVFITFVGIVVNFVSFRENSNNRISAVGLGFGLESRTHLFGPDEIDMFHRW